MKQAQNWCGYFFEILTVQTPDRCGKSSGNNGKSLLPAGLSKPPQKYSSKNRKEVDPRPASPDAVKESGAGKACSQRKQPDGHGPSLIGRPRRQRKQGGTIGKIRKSGGAPEKSQTCTERKNQRRSRKAESGSRFSVFCCLC